MEQFFQDFLLVGTLVAACLGVGVLINLQPETAQGFAWYGGALRNRKEYGSATAGTSKSCPPLKTAEERDAAVAKYVKRVEASYWKKFPSKLERMPAFCAAAST